MSNSRERGSGPREEIEPNEDDVRYSRRDDEGQFTEQDDETRSLAKDVRQRAKTEVKPGYGDRGDQPRRD
jgi:hypothetical protein